MNNFTVRRNKKTNSILILIVVFATIFGGLLTVFLYQLMIRLKAADQVAESMLISLPQFEIPFFIHLSGLNIYLFTPTALVTAISLILSPIFIASWVMWEVRVDGDKIHYRSLTRKRTYTFSDIRRIDRVRTNSRHIPVYKTRFYSNDDKILFSVMDSYVGCDSFMDRLAARNVEGVQTVQAEQNVQTQQGAQTEVSPAQEAAASSEAHFIVRPNKKNRIIMTLAATLLLLILIYFFLSIYFGALSFEGEPRSLVGLILLTVLFVFCEIGAIYEISRKLTVEAGNIHEKSLFHNRTLAFDDIKTVSMDKEAKKLYLYSEDKRVFIDVKTDDICYDLFIDWLAARNIEVERDNRPEMSQEVETARKRLLKIQILLSAAAFVLFLAVVMCADFMPLLFFASTGREVVQMILLSYEVALYGSFAVLFALWVGDMCIIISLSRIENPSKKGRIYYVAGFNAVIAVAAVLALIYSQGDVLMPLLVFFVASTAFMVAESGFTYVGDGVAIWDGDDSVTWRAMAMGGVYALIAALIFFMPFSEGRVIIHRVKNDLAAIESGELLEGIMSFSAEEMAGGMEYTKEPYWNEGGLKPLYGFPNNPVMVYSVHERRPKFPQSLGPSALREMLPPEALGRNVGHRFRVRYTPYSYIVIDVVIDDTPMSRHIDDVATEIGEIVEFDGIEWRVLDLQDGKMLLISKYILETRAFQDPELSRVPATWETSSLREYLNSDLYNCLTPEVRDRIAETTTVNNHNPWYEPVKYGDTVDKLFLLSLDEVTRYFDDSGQFVDSQGQNVIDDQNNEARTATRFVRTSVPLSNLGWWLRTSGSSDQSALVIGSDGSIRGNGALIYNDWGVRPALWLYLFE